MSRKRFVATRFLVSLDPETLGMLKAIAADKTNGNGAEAVRYSVRCGYREMKAESQKPQEPQEPANPPAPEASQESLPLGDG